MKHFIPLQAYIVSLVFLLVTFTSRSQNPDSLFIEEVKNIEISINSLDEISIENLYLTDVSYSVFYDALSPVGEWIQITPEEIEEELRDGEGQGKSFSRSEDDFLFIWKPKISDINWKPYSQGSWQYTDHGWLWMSSESWGWATYHYGRWVNSKKYGWIWIPGKVWAPAWVQWRISNDNIGWTALTTDAKWKVNEGITNETYKYSASADDWIFVDKSKFQDEFTSGNVIPSTQNSGLIKASSKVTEIKYENEKIINRGPDRKDIENRTGKVIKEYKVKPTTEKKISLSNDNGISVYKDKFKKLSYDKDIKKYKFKDRPKKFKRSQKIKKIMKKKIENKRRKEKIN
jgi:hypothetical protein